MEKSTDILLIGAGPLGIEMAVALQRANLSYLHVEAAQIGATMQWWAPGTRWFSSNDRISLAGVPLATPFQEKATREEYLAYLRSIVTQFNLQIDSYTRITHIERAPDNTFLLRAKKSIAGQLLGEEQTYRAKRLILSTGGTERPNRLHIPGEDLPHVSHYFHDPHTYFNRSLLIVGGRNSAVEAALRCHRAGAKVHFSYRRPQVDAKDIKYWLYPEFSSLLQSGAITPHLGTIPSKITPTHVTLVQTASSTDSQIPHEQFRAPSCAIDFVLLMTGYVADMSLATAAGIHLTTDQELPLYNPDTMESSTPNVYVIGTAIAGTQRRYKVFLENCHIHVPRVLAHLTNQPAPAALPTPTYDRPES
jgi:thioredoxin reductase (NADPH)